MLINHLLAYKHVVIMEECMAHCGVHNELESEILRNYPSKTVDCIHLGSNYVTHGSLDDLYKHCGLDRKSVANRIWEVLQSES